MTFLGAITSHVVWKKNLMSLIMDNKINRLNESVDKNNICGLGLWFQNNEEQLSKLDKFEDAKSSLFSFHESVAQVIQYVNEQKQKDAVALLSGECANISHQLQNDLRLMAREINKH
jgi:hypothetical protein